jgi:hypothetical protein
MADPEDALRRLVAKHTVGRQMGFLGEPRVNVLELNLELDRQFSNKGGRSCRLMSAEKPPDIFRAMFSRANLLRNL